MAKTNARDSVRKFAATLRKLFTGCSSAPLVQEEGDVPIQEEIIAPSLLVQDNGERDMSQSQRARMIVQHMIQRDLSFSDYDAYMGSFYGEMPVSELTKAPVPIPSASRAIPRALARLETTMGGMLARRDLPVFELPKAPVGTVSAHLKDVSASLKASEASSSSIGPAARVLATPPPLGPTQDKDSFMSLFETGIGLPVRRNLPVFELPKAPVGSSSSSHSFRASSSSAHNAGLVPIVPAVALPKLDGLNLVGKPPPKDCRAKSSVSHSLGSVPASEAMSDIIIPTNIQASIDGLDATHPFVQAFMNGNSKSIFDGTMGMPAFEIPTACRHSVPVVGMPAISAPFIASSSSAHITDPTVALAKFELATPTKSSEPNQIFLKAGSNSNTATMSEARVSKASSSFSIKTTAAGAKTQAKSVQELFMRMFEETSRKNLHIFAVPTVSAPLKAVQASSSFNPPSKASVELDAFIKRMNASQECAASKPAQAALVWSQGQGSS